MWGIGIDEIIKRNWKYGYVFIGQYVNEKTINYVVKYMLKKDKDHKEYNPTVLCNAGIGVGYLNRKHNFAEFLIIDKLMRKHVYNLRRLYGMYLFCSL